MAKSLFAFAYATSQQVKVRWQVLTGSPSEFSLQARFFHSTSLCIILLATCYVPYDLFAGLFVAALSSFLMAVFFFYGFFRSRFHHRPHSNLLFGIVGLLVFSVNFFSNAGIEGSTDLIWPVYLLLLLTICPYRQYLAWIVVYLVVFAFIHLVAYLYPGLVSYPFRTGKNQLIDRITAFPIPVITISIIIGLFRKSYDREREAVRQRDVEKSRLLSILSHDLRAPFIQIQQYLEIIGDTELSATDRAAMEKILRRTNDQTLEMLTGLLYWSRSQLEGGAVHLAQLPLSETLANTMAIAESLTTQKSIVLESCIDPSIRVIGDADMLQLVVRNLLQNAVKFTAAGGSIRVEAAPDGRIVRLSVSDTGIGMSPEKLATLFSGNTAPSHGTAGEKGVGLGLLLCREFVALQNGQIIVKSEPGKGSKFTVELPLGS
jgi:two-component system, sensor histidine kinase and response regulator